MAQSVADKLDEARALIEKGWCQGAYRRGECFCVYGAIRQVVLGATDIFSAKVKPCIDYVDRAIGCLDMTPDDWNDQPERTQAEVIDAFKRAAELARDEQA